MKISLNIFSVHDKSLKNLQTVPLGVGISRAEKEICRIVFWLKWAHVKYPHGQDYPV